MSAKLLNAFTDENPDLHKQIGCMTGIFQMFDRHLLLTGRRRHRKGLPSGSVGDDVLPDSHLRADANSISSQIVLEKNLSKSLNENQRVSVESSRTSFSSSSCSSSFSSLECNKSIQQESSFERTTIPERSLKNPTTLQSSEIERRILPSPHHLYPQSPSASSCRQSLDFRDVVKESIYRDAHSLSIETSNKGEVKKHVLKPKDSPRPLPLSETTDRSYLIGKNEKPKMSEDLNRSIRVLAKLKEAPRYFSENKLKLSYEAKDGSFCPMALEASRFSYDGREISRSSVDSREQNKCSTRIKELPRLSLDSRKSSMSSNFDSKSNSLMRDLEGIETNQKSYRSLTLEQDLDTHRQPTSVVAKLMGLEAMPLSSGIQDNSQFGKRSINDSNTFHNFEAISPSSKSLKMPRESQEEWRSCSPKSSIKNAAVPQLRSPEPAIKHVSNSRIPTETAPWKQGKSKGKTPQMAFGCRQGHAEQQHESVYSEIGRKLKELEFQQSNKDLRALKQILDAIQAKGLVERKRDETTSSEVSYKKSNSNKAVIVIHQNLRTANRQNPQTSRQDTMLMKGSNTSRPSEAPIVIMKPAKSINKSRVPAASVIPFDGLSSLRKVCSGDDTDMKRIPVNNCLAKEGIPGPDLKEPAIQILLSPSKNSSRHKEENTSLRAHVQTGQVSPRLQQLTKENGGSTVKTSGSVSPRRQLKKIELERKSRPPVPSSESIKSRKHSPTRHVSESVSPRSKVRSKSEQVQQNSDKLSKKINDKRNLNNHSDEVSLRTESSISLASDLDMEETSGDQSVDLVSVLDSGSPTNSAVSNISSIIKEKKSLKDFSEDASTELSIASLDQPSPVSVLDASFCRDDLPHSPIDRISNSFRGFCDGFSNTILDSSTFGYPATGDDVQNPDATTSGGIWKTAGPGSHLPNDPNCDLNSTRYHQKLESIENLLQKLRKLSLSSDGSSPVTDHVASTCEMRSSDDEYVSEVVLASGLLDTAPSNSRVPFQLHKSGYAMDPNMFYVLEHTKLAMAKPQSLHEGAALQSKRDAEKLHRRRLLFDAVNEILTQKLADDVPAGEELLKQLCSEIERLQRAHSRSGVSLDGEEDGGDGLKPVLCEDVARQTEWWKDSGKEVGGVVLDVERSIFRDLISEVVNGEACAFVLAAKPSRRHRQLFRC